jgi:hypothetical protein
MEVPKLNVIAGEAVLGMRKAQALKPTPGTFRSGNTCEGLKRSGITSS